MNHQGAVIMTTDIIYHEKYTKHELSPGHPESPMRLISALDQLRGTGLMNSSKTCLVTPKEANLDEVYPIHDQRYIDDIRLKSESGGGFFTLDTSSNKYTFEAALLAAGGGIMAVDRIMDGVSDNAFVLCRPPGHHAEYNRAFGFCFINNIAVAAQHLQDKQGLEKILIVDYDAHHGNGTQNSFYSSNSIVYVGLHQDGRTLFPGSGAPYEIGSDEGEGYTVNLAMYPGAGDRSYEIAFEDIIEPLSEHFRPDFVLVSVGFDGHFEDPLTSLGLTSSGFSMMNERLHKIAKEYSQGRLAYFLEGGYNLDNMRKGVQNLVEELSGSEITKFEDSHTESDICTNFTNSLIETLRSKLDGTLL